MTMRRLLETTAALGLLAALALPAPAPAENVNRIVLRVNDEVVTLHEYEQRKSGEVTRILSDSSLSADDRQAQVERIGKEVMQSLYGELLLLSYADQHGIRVSDEEVESALAEMQQRQGIENRAQLEQALAGVGLTYDAWRESTRRELLWSQVVGREVNSKVDVGEEELRAYYRNNRSQFERPERRQIEEIIVLESSGLASGALEEKAAEIRGRLGAGVDLATVAEEGQAGELTTGVIDLGWIERGDLEPSLAEVAWKLGAGEISQPVEGRGGYHILHLVDVEEATLRPFEEVEEAILRRERARRFQKELKEFLDDLERKAYVVENLPPEAVGYRNLAEGFDESDEDLGGVFFSPLDESSGDEPTGEASGDAG